MGESTQSLLRTVFEGVSIKFVGTLFSRVVGFATTLLLTNHLTTDQYGIFAYALGLLMFIGPLKLFGSRGALKKLIPKYADSPETQRSILDVSITTTFIGNVLVHAVLFYFAPHISAATVNDPLLVGVFRILVVVSIFESLRKTLTGSLLGFKQPVVSNTIDNLVYPVIRATATALPIVLGLTIFAIAGSILIGSILGLLIALFWYLRVAPVGLGFSLPSLDEKYREYYDFATTITVLDFGNRLFSNADIVILGLFVSSELIGIYRISFLLSTVIYLPVSGIGQVFPSIVSQYYEEDNKEELQTVFKTVSRWSFSLSLVLLLGALTYSNELLALFGESYSRGSQILIIIGVAQFIGSWVGTCGQVLVMHGHQRLATAQTWLFGLVNVGLNLLLIPRLGVLGAVIAMFIGFVTLNLTQVAEVWYLENMLPISVALYKPTVAGSIAGAVMLLMKNLLSGVLLVFIGGSVGVVVFFLMLILLGIEETDKRLFRSFTAG